MKKFDGLIIFLLAILIVLFIVLITTQAKAQATPPACIVTYKTDNQVWQRHDGFEPAPQGARRLYYIQYKWYSKAAGVWLSGVALVTRGRYNSKRVGDTIVIHSNEYLN